MTKNQEVILTSQGVNDKVTTFIIINSISLGKRGTKRPLSSKGAESTWDIGIITTEKSFPVPLSLHLQDKKHWASWYLEIENFDELHVISLCMCENAGGFRWMCFVFSFHFSVFLLKKVTFATQVPVFYPESLGLGLLFYCILHDNNCLGLFVGKKKVGCWRFI